MKKSRLHKYIGRNEKCPCGSSIKFKRCHGRNSSDRRVVTRKEYIDAGEIPIRWVIANEKATAFFSDIKNRILVFADRQVAVDVTRLDIFASAGEGEINLAGVGPKKWQHLQETLPFIEVGSLEMAKALLQERIEQKTEELGSAEEEKDSNPEQ
jgi:hypothetical protein